MILSIILNHFKLWPHKNVYWIGNPLPLTPDMKNTNLIHISPKTGLYTFIDKHSAIPQNDYNYN